jgi:dTDP-4-amino-4,6-dideoxygalactose transaminase
MDDSKAYLRQTVRKVTTGTFKSTPRMEELVLGALRSGRISYGPLSMAFEREFAAYHNTRYAVLSNSGTSSLHVAVQALKELRGWPDGLQVIVPASTFVATVNVILHNRLKPVFVDVEPLTYGIDPALVEAAITDDTVAILPAHLYGQSCEMDALMEVAKRHGLAVIEDSCETMFVKHRGKYVGSMGDVGCFSFYNAHLLTTGVGGMCTTNDPKLAQKIRSLVNHGLDISELNVDEWFSPRPNPGRSFRFTHAGHSFRITEMEAALGLAQLETHHEMLSTRRRNARHLTARLQALNTVAAAGLFLPEVADGNEHAWMMYPFVMDPKRMPKATFRPYLNEAGIETRDLMPIIHQPIYKGMLDPTHYPIAEWLERDGLYIGCHQDLTPDDMEYVAQVFEDWLHANP